MAMTFEEEIRLQAAFMHIKRERKESLRTVFVGTQLRPKSRAEDAKALCKSVKDSKDKLAALPGVSIPILDTLSLNLNMFKGIVCVGWSIFVFLPSR